MSIRWIYLETLENTQITALLFVDATVKCSIDTRNSPREIEDVTTIPAQWAQLMDNAGITSLRQLAKAADLSSHNITNNVIIKGAKTSDENMQKIATALHVPVERLYEITTGVAAKPLALPLGTEKLTPRQQEAVKEIIRTLVEANENAPELVHKKSPETTQSDPEKTTVVTPIRGRRTLTPAQVRFEAAGRKVAKIPRNIPQDPPKVDPVSPDTDE